MALLDRFKSRPSWQHADAALRAAAIADLSGDDQHILASVAREDADAGVRRVAVARLLDTELLASSLNADADERVRLAARERLLELAVGEAETVALEALAAFSGERDFTLVARGAACEAVAQAALARLQERRQVSLVARHSQHSTVRLEALSRVDQAEDLQEIAANSEHKDVGLAALERLGDAVVLDAIAARARNKVVARRARALWRALEAQPRPPSAEERQSRIADVLVAMSRLLRVTDAHEGASQLEDLEDQWYEAAGESPTAEARRAFDEAQARVRQHLEGLRAASEAADRDRREQQTADEQRARICEALEQLGDGPEQTETLESLEAAWSELRARTASTSPNLEARFAQAVTTWRQKQDARLTAEGRAQRLETLAAQAHEVASLEPLADAEKRWAALEREWQQLSVDTPVPPEVQEPFVAASTEIMARLARAQEDQRRQERENLGRWTRLGERAERLLASPSLTLKEAERCWTDLRNVPENLGRLPDRADHEKLKERLRGAQAALHPKLLELREAEDWKRWANAGVQEELCVKAEALASLDDLGEVAKQLRELRRQWAGVSAAPRAISQQLWHRFKVACDQARQRAQEHFSRQAEQAESNLARKQQLCEQAEALAESTDWVKTAQTLQTLQSEWKSVGPTTREQSEELFRRFRAACDKFFTRRKEDLSRRKESWAANLQRKEQLCADAEKWAESTTWAEGVAAFKKLQTEWKTVGPVRPNKSEALWQRFRAAADHFFERYKNRDQLELSARVAERETLVTDLEALMPPEGDESPGPASPDLVARVKTAWSAWRQSRPLPRDAADAVQRRFETALGRIVEAYPDHFRRTDLDFDANRRRMEELCGQVEALATGGRSPTELGTASAATLAALLREALAANTIGGKVDPEAQRRAAQDAVRQLREAWKRIGPVPGETGRSLAARFHAACRRFDEGQTRARGGRPERRDAQRPTA